MHLRQAKVGHAGLSIMSARNSDIKQQNAQTNREKMTVRISLLVQAKEIAKAAEAADKAVDEVHQDRTMVARLLRSGILLNPVMKKVVTT